jgi:enoyl-CoA hydratase/carnithine racemase
MRILNPGRVTRGCTGATHARARDAPDMTALAVDRGESRWHVTFANAPANLVDPEMIVELQAIVDEVEHDRDATVVVFRSGYADHFLGPYDVTRVADTPTEPGPTGMPPWLDMTARLSRLPAVSIAVMRGASRGVGQEFALACDLRFASLEHTAIDQPEVAGGLVPGGGAISRLPALVGRGRALELILGSVVMDGATAERYGVVNRAVPDAELDAYVDELAGRLAGFDRRAVADAKALVDRSTLPAQAELIEAYEAFFASAARRSAVGTTS